MIPVTVLLAAHNGERYLSEQLASIEAQRLDARIDILVSDDRSVDGTRTILAEWQRRWTKGDFTIIDGPGLGFAANFRALMTALPPVGGYVAFSDQDDVWMPDKLSAAIAAIEGDAGPALYCSRTQIVDARLRPVSRSPLFRRPPHFRNALVQSIAGGNTMVLNAAAFALVAESARRTSFVSHDWWCYLLISGAGGRVVYDAEPHIAYRQHAGNLVGHNTGLKARWIRLRKLLQGQFVRWNDANIAALEVCRDLLTDQSARTVDQFVEIRRTGLIRRLYLLQMSGIYRQLPAANISLALAAILRKL